MINIHKLKSDFYIGDTNIYLFQYNGKTNLIDCGFISNSIIDELKSYTKTIDNLFLTHGHFDHICGIQKIIDAFPCINCYIHKDELNFLTDDSLNASYFFSKNFNLENKYLKNIKTFQDGDIIDGVKIIHTPGHTIGSSSFLIEEENICFTGDTMFANNYGRCDLETGNYNQMKESLTKIFALNKETLIYPGHGRSIILKDNKIGN